MLFNHKFSEISGQIEENISQADKLSQKLQDLEAENQKYQEYLQKLETASKASESALEQLRNAFYLLQDIDPSQLDILKQEIDNVYQEIATPENTVLGNLASTRNPHTLKSADLEEINHIRQPRKSQITKSNCKRKSTTTANKKKPVGEDEAKSVSVEVLEPESNSSPYEAVLRLQNLLQAN